MTGLGNIDDVYRHYFKVIEENKQLRKFLKDCKPALSHLGKWNTQRQSLLIRISAAIGEKEE